MNRLLVIFFGVALAAAGTPADEVRIDTGRLSGTSSGTVTAFKGIPFAAPPVGPNRWRAPQPVQAWTGVRAASDYGPDCMQKPFPGDAAPLGVPPAEDCLYVNVWTPAGHKGGLPVMVWIYGGGFVNGGSSPSVYDGTRFAQDGIVFVSFNYRVGRFGFFAHPALTKENPSGPLGNYAFMDQIAALKWVQRNIRGFGGDPHKVTLFGESAGGISVLTLLTSPAAHGLFQRAIVESGGGRAILGPTRRLHESSPHLPSAEDVGIAFAKENGIDGTDAGALEALRALPAEKVVNGLNMSTMNTPTYSGPMLDGTISVQPVEQALKDGHFQKMPLIIGANSSEFGFVTVHSLDELYAQFGKNAAAARAVYNPTNSEDLRTLSMTVGADRSFVEPARFVVRTMRAARQPAYEYRFSYVAESMRQEWHGAPHATEIPYVFDTVAAHYGDKLTDSDKAAAAAAHAYWVAFVKTGDPNGGGRPHWPVYDTNSDTLLNFTEHGPVAEPDPWRKRLDLEQEFAETPK